MNTKKALYGVIGVAAFVIGGIVARTKALETAEMVEDFFAKDRSAPPLSE